MSTPAGAEGGRGLTARLRRVLEVLLTMLQSRFELASLELREEMLRWLGVVFLGALAFFAGQLGLLLLTLAVVALFPEQAAWTLAVAGGLYLAGAAGCLLFLRRQLKDRRAPFGDSVAELKKDREWLSSWN
jgi:uncharacterized membrane protein YqjE